MSSRESNSDHLSCRFSGSDAIVAATDAARAFGQSQWLGDDELASIVDEAIAEAGAEGPQDMGKVMGPAMAKVAGRADGKRVSALVRERLA